MGLEGKTILVTRQREQSVEFIAEVERLGGRTELLPLINIQDPESWEDCDRALQQAKSYNALIFTSTNAVEKFFHRCTLRAMEPIAFHHCEVYAVGEKTKQAVEQKGLRVNAIPDQFSSASLAEFFRGRQLTGKRFLHPRGDLGRAELVKSLIQQGESVDPVVVYRNTGPAEVDTERVYRKLTMGEIDVVTFASPSAAMNFAKLFPQSKMESMDKRVRIAVIGPTTREALVNLGMKVDIMARQATVEGMVDAIESYYESR